MSNLLVEISALVEDRASSCVHALDDQMVEHHLPLGSLHYLLLHAVLGHQSVHRHLAQIRHKYTTTLHSTSMAAIIH